MKGNVVTVERVIKAPAAAIFDLLADPAQHHAIDGSGSVQQPVDPSPTRVSLGSVFGMSMKLGINYRMQNKVIEFEENRRLAWQTGPKGLMAAVGGGRIWRYELEEVDGGTLVKESWDISHDKMRAMFRHIPMAKQTEVAMTKSLENLAKMTEGA